jgi:hypothetical protein
MAGMVPVGIGAVMNCAKVLGMVVQKAGTIGIIPAARRFTVPDRATTRVPLQWEALTLTLSDHLATPSLVEVSSTLSPAVPAATIPLRRKIFTVYKAASTRPLFPAEDAIVDRTGAIRGSETTQTYCVPITPG